jgi:hypothetical protein
MGMNGLINVIFMKEYAGSEGANSLPVILICNMGVYPEYMRINIRRQYISV